MNVLVCNPPWFGPGRWGLRVGADPPRLVPEGDLEAPWPEPLASATTFLREHGVTAYLVDSIAVRESAASCLERIRDLSADLVALATSSASLADDLPLIRAAAELRPVVVLWPGGSGGSDLLLDIPGVRAVVCGEPERGLLAAALLTDHTVYPPDPLPPAELPRPYRDYLVHRYRYPLAGLPAGPQLVLRAGRGPGRWRPVAALLDDLAFCRRNYPRLTHCALADPELNREPEAFAELVEALAVQDWPWAVRVTLDAPLPTELRRAAALEVSFGALPDEDHEAALAELAAAGVALTLAPAPRLQESAEAVRELASRTAARELVWRPGHEPLKSVAEALSGGEESPVILPKRRRLYVVGMHVPWYMPPWLVDGAAQAGYDAVAVDPFADPREIRKVLDSLPEEIVLIDRGHFLPPELLPKIAARTVLYYPDMLPMTAGAEPLAHLKYAEFLRLAPHVDDVILHDSASLEWLRLEGHRNIRGAVLLPYDPKRHRDLGLERHHDIVFIGSTSPHRIQWLDHLRAEGLEVERLEAWGDDYIQVLNQSKIILNLHVTSLPNTELRLVEAMACGCLVVSEPTTEPPVFRNGQHLVTVSRETAVETIRYYLDHPEAREPIVRAAAAYVADNFTARHCIERLIKLLPERP